MKEKEREKYRIYYTYIYLLIRYLIYHFLSVIHFEMNSFEFLKILNKTVKTLNMK